MHNLIPFAKAHVPQRVWKSLTAPYWWWYNRARHQVAAIFDERLRESQRAVAGFRDCHAGQRCFIVGNGPSLRRTDLQRLRGEITFGMNRIYLLFSEIGFETTYYVAINTLVIEQCAQEIRHLPMPKFVTWRGRRWLGCAPNLYYLDTDYTPPATFATDVSQRVFEGSTVTYVALQLAFHMGFREVILIGVDHTFATKGQPNVTVVSEGDDRNHFSPEYFGRGFRWQLPDLEASEKAYRLARQAYECAGRRVLDATIGGKLTVFPKVDYHNLFSQRQ